VALLTQTWNSLKTWRRFRLGPVSLIFRFGRTVPVSKNSARRRGDFRRSATGLLPVESAVDTSSPEIAVIFGVGPGLGIALAEKLVSAGANVALVSRQSANLQKISANLNSQSTGGQSFVYSCDATDERGVREVLALVSRDIGTPTLVVFSMQYTVPGRAIDITTAAFEESWRIICLGGFIVAREAARMMQPHGRGSIILIGSTSGMIGRDGHLTHAVGKFGLRAVSQVMARELWQEGLHVAHVVIDADIAEPDADPDPYASDPKDIAEAIYAVHRQRPGAWSSEIDLRSSKVPFWEHC
jgi:NAD(P)-dependent dehydrogenase (short-subunit alcohol dehydrogenase family)